jgi:serine-type D-Ala-D-Ala carboxypeptidase/endopeptidase (penicillin-binding protein 4)
MQNSDTTWHLPAGRRRTGRIVLSAFCILHFAFLGCAKQPPATTPSAPAPSATAAPPAPAAPAPPVAPSEPVPPKPDPLADLRRDILAATNSPGVQRGVWGVIVHSLDKNERLFEFNPRLLLVPASTAKIVTVAATADTVGWNYRYRTTLRATGQTTGGVLRGDLVAVGSGDPSVGGPAGDDLSVWVARLKAAGIRRIEGRIVGDDDAIEEPRPQLAWAWDDLGYVTGAVFGALNVAENRTTITISPGKTETAPTTISVDPRAAYRTLTNRSVTGPAGSIQLLWPEQRPGETSLTIGGSIPVGNPPVTIGIAVGNPTLWFANVLRNRLIRDGIEVTGEAADIDDISPPPASANATVVYTHQSRTLAEIAKPLLKDSINLYAEALLRLNAAPGAFPTNDAALEGLRMRLDAWGVPRDSYQLVDGSGLSRRSTVTPDTLLAVLQRMHDPSGVSPFVSGLPIAGVDGSLASRMKGTPAENNLRAKTGTMSNIRTMAGYVTTRDGERVALVIMINNFEGIGTQANAAIDRIAVSVAAFSRDALAR